MPNDFSNAKRFSKMPDFWNLAFKMPNWQPCWLDEKDCNGDCLSEYVRKLAQPGAAFCIFCQRRFDYGGKGKSSIKSHSQSKSHKRKRNSIKTTQSLSAAFQATAILEGGETPASPNHLPYGAATNVMDSLAFASIDDNAANSESPHLNKDSESQQQSSLRTQVWDCLQRTGYASLATESTVSQMIEMLMNDTLKTEDQLAALLGIKPEPKDVDVEDCEDPLDERLHEKGFLVDIDVDQTTVNCVELSEISENDTKGNCDKCFEKPSTSQNASDDNESEEMLQKEKKVDNSCNKNIPPSSGLESNIKAQTGEIRRGNLTSKSSSLCESELKNPIQVPKEGKTSKELHFQSGLKNDQKIFFGKNECPICGRMLKSKCSLMRHLLTHTGEKAYPCLTCGRTFADKITLKTHSRLHTGEKPYQCLICGKAFADHSSMNKHSRMHSGEKPFQCHDCGKTFSLRSSLQTHSRIHSGEKPYQCLTCGKAFADSSVLREHSRIHSGEKPYKCLTCGKAFIQSSAMRRHSKVHSGEKPFPCHDCGKLFADRSALNKHTRTHSGEKPYQCLTCGKTFTHSSNLQTHSRVHSGEKPFQCHDCGKAFADRSALNRHTKIHSGEKPYHCLTCGKTFTQSSNLQIHSRTHSG